MEWKQVASFYHEACSGIVWYLVHMQLHVHLTSSVQKVVHVTSFAMYVGRPSPSYLTLRNTKVSWFFSFSLISFYFCLCLSTEKITTSPFLYLSLDLPTTPLFQVGFFKTPSPRPLCTCTCALYVHVGWAWEEHHSSSSPLWPSLQIQWSCWESGYIIQKCMLPYTCTCTQWTWVWVLAWASFICIVL